MLEWMYLVSVGPFSFSGALARARIPIYISVAKPKGRFAEKEKVSQEGAIVKER